MPPSPPIKVFVVEDEPIIQNLLSSQLKLIGAEVVGTARSMKKAVELAKTIESDIAILDVFLGIDYSFPVAEILDQRGIPYIYATGHPLQLDLNGRERAPSVEKPFRSEDLKAAMDRSFRLRKERPFTPPGMLRRLWRRLT